MFKRHLWISVLAVLSLLLVTLVTACNSSTGAAPTATTATQPTAAPAATKAASSPAAAATPATAATTPAKTGGVIKIGVNTELTGAAAAYGDGGKKGIEIAKKDVNDAGGVLGKQIEVVYADNKTDPTEAANAMTKLISTDKVAAVIGTFGSSDALAAAPIAQKNKIVYMVTGATNADITLTGDFVFRDTWTDPYQGAAGANFALQTLKAKTAGLLIDTGIDYAVGLSKTFKETFTKGSGKIVADEGFVTGDKDFRAALTKILAQKPDIIYCPNMYNESGLIVRQAREAGFKGAIVGGDGSGVNQFIEVAGASNAENVFITSHFAPDDPDPIMQGFIKKYETSTKEKFNGASALAYDGFMLVVDAIKRAGSEDSTKIRDALTSTKDFKGITGVINFNSTRDAVKPGVIVTVKNGEWVFHSKIN